LPFGEGEMPYGVSSAEMSFGNNSGGMPPDNGPKNNSGVISEYNQDKSNNHD
jgi:hypothetical protein